MSYSNPRNTFLYKPTGVVRDNVNGMTSHVNFHQPAKLLEHSEFGREDRENCDNPFFTIDCIFARANQLGTATHRSSEVVYQVRISKKLARHQTRKGNTMNV
jgi:hypothetical protein